MYLIISKIQKDSRCLIFDPTLKLDLKIDDQLLCIEDNELNINVFANTKEEILNE